GAAVHRVSWPSSSRGLRRGGGERLSHRSGGAGARECGDAEPGRSGVALPVSGGLGPPPAAVADGCRSCQGAPPFTRSPQSRRGAPRVGAAAGGVASRRFAALRLRFAAARVSQLAGQGRRFPCWRDPGTAGEGWSGSGGAVAVGGSGVVGGAFGAVGG